MRVLPSILLLLSFAKAEGQGDFRYVEDSSVIAPPMAREFRAVWIATVANIDWPSKPGLTPEQQRTEMIAILDRAYHLRMNAVILQVRPTSDALYPSKLEPWSWYLTGNMGRAPEPYYDPLLFTIGEARRRNLEVHAWFNPFRARHPSAKGNVSENHITRKRPDLVRKYASLEWLDPGDPQVQSHALSVILDVLHRYDLDGIHIDDYFYPYPEKSRDGKIIPFPDGATYGRYRRAGGQLAVADWRRDNVNRFVKHLYKAVKEEKPWVKFGVSPFGIWRPGHPESIKGMDAFDTLYADALTWWQLGWVDYLAPQLYWSIDDVGQSFPVLLDWWSAQNKQGRHLWPGISVRGTSEDRQPAEIMRQISAVRIRPNVTGQIYWGMNSILTNRLGIAHHLQQRAYTTPALVPASTWLSSSPPAKPRLHFGIREDSSLAAFHWQAGSTNEIHKWILQEYDGREWKTQILSGGQLSRFVHPPFDRNLPAAAVLTPLNRAGVAGPQFRASLRSDHVAEKR
ncbi:MAG: family 10 glycosylhydrolase [Verrucomicrobiae bacterium]|nr:family 10 glycosylhydrolase [Verrucomicrobiae bacterium]